MTEPYALFDVEPLPYRFRPPHYLIAEADEPDSTPSVTEWHDDIALALANAEYTNSLWSPYRGALAGVWDNWLGAWVLVPDWAHRYDLAADGWTRYDLRPLEAST